MFIITTTSIDVYLAKVKRKIKTILSKSLTKTSIPWKPVSFFAALITYEQEEKGGHK
jgi:hypothetical protein